MPKQDLVFKKPFLNAAGSLGFSPDLRAPLDWDSFGAFITNPISMRRRLPTATPALIEYAGGLLIHSGLPNPGFRTVVNQFSRSWAQSPLPIIVNLMADRPEETRAMVIALEAAENTLAVELSFAPLLADDIILLAVEMSVGELPMIVSLPADQVLRLGPLVEARGAAAISLCPPRGSIPHLGQSVSGRLFGPSLFPMSVELVRSACRLGLTIIGSGGVTSQQDADAMLAVGAIAIQVDIGLWLPSPIAESPVN